MNQPMLIRNGRAYPITAAQLDAGRRCRPMGAIPGLTGPAAQPQAATPTAAPLTPTAPDGRAISRASMLKEVGARYGQDARAAAEAKPGRRTDVDPKLNVIGRAAPKAAEAADGRALARSSMLREIERIGGGVR